MALYLMFQKNMKFLSDLPNLAARCSFLGVFFILSQNSYGGPCRAKKKKKSQTHTYVARSNTEPSAQAISILIY